MLRASGAPQRPRDRGRCRLGRGDPLAARETYEKLDWYAAQGVLEVLVVHPIDRRIELYVLRGGRLVLVQADAAGEVASEVLGAASRPWPGPGSA